MRLRLTYANVVSTLCLFLLLGGGAAFAATKLAKNSVGTKQIKNSSIIAAKVKANSLLASDFAAGQLPKGEQGSKGEQGKQGERGEQGKQGEQGERGEAGLSALSTLPPGHSESGEVAAIGSNSLARQHIEDTVTFMVPLKEALPEANVIFTTLSGTTHCSGVGHADPGYLCIYVASQGNVGTSASFHFESGQESGAGPDGFGAFWEVVTAGTEAWAEGSWTVTG